MIDGSHDQTLEDSDVLSLVLEALRRDLAGNPWYDKMREPGRSALTAAAVASFAEVLPGFATYARACAVEGAIITIGELRGEARPDMTAVEETLTHLVIELEDRRDRLTEPDGRSFFETTEGD